MDLLRDVIVILPDPERQFYCYLNLVSNRTSIEFDAKKLKSLYLVYMTYIFVFI